MYPCHILLIAFLYNCGIVVYGSKIYDAAHNAALEGSGKHITERKSAGQVNIQSEITSSLLLTDAIPGIKSDRIYKICDVQGKSHSSPFVGENVTVVGIVTATSSNGFFMQDSLGDGNLATSDGIFISNNPDSNIKVGDLVEVRGHVSEQMPDIPDSRSLTITQITNSPIVSVKSSGNAIPKPVIIGSEAFQRHRPMKNVRAPPKGLIENDSFRYFEPTKDAIDFFESLEGMYVIIRSPITVSTWGSVGELWVLADNGADSADTLGPRKVLITNITNFNPNKIRICPDSSVFDTETSDQAPGAKLEDIHGIITYSSSGYHLLPTRNIIVRNSSRLQPQITKIRPKSQWKINRTTIATMNILNLNPREDYESAHAIANTIVNNLQVPDVIALQGVMDNNGIEENEVVSAEKTLRTLVSAISTVQSCLEKQICPTYDFIDNNFITAGSNGGPVGGNIRVAFLYNPERILLLPESVHTIVNTDSRADEESPFIDSRLPLVAQFSRQGRIFEIINVHFTSKRNSAPLFGNMQPVEFRQNDSNINGGSKKRVSQAQAVRNYINSKPTSIRAHMVVAGDFNDNEFSATVATISKVPQMELSTNLTSRTNRYTVIIDGNGEAISHIITGRSLSAYVDIVHAYAEFPNQPSKQDPVLVSIRL